ncbi:grasp-with-spasm system ATP-grasp peptide maturase [Flavobacterium sp. PL02]|uniref:grasp-with-spasm system ATP-grasp peptide maturase n=1 Tax=Flavobacterium sp. PL02 TaxID=3088354 RepID=UPI002B23BF4C|nr:grasp-with-spasm system ATP-grasp peptide maturase [Flavobacterium sp. PL02]MEA9414326.1 grasp-with-spasm system ATP-grasp peptide maturase [Flavobacterium sp. PL02]
MIVIQSIRDDFSTNDVLDWLYFSKSDPVLRLNDSIAVESITIDEKVVFSFENTQLDLEEISSYWYRRGNLRTPKNKLKNLTYLAQKLSTPLFKEIDSAYAKVDLASGKNAIGKYADNTIDKIQMLVLAVRSGLKVPKSIVTGKTKKLNEFIALCPSKIITKAIDIDVMTLENYPGFNCSLTLATTIITPESFKNTNIENCTPALFQQYIEKKYELRVFYLRGKFYSMAIFSQRNEKTKIDFRNYDKDMPNRTVPYTLPDEIQHKITAFMQCIGLDTGSLDLIYSIDNEYVFLEVNPIGQYQWLEKNCNYPISKEIAEDLMYYG